MDFWVGNSFPWTRVAVLGEPFVLSELFMLLPPRRTNDGLYSGTVRRDCKPSSYESFLFWRTPGTPKQFSCEFFVKSQNFCTFRIILTMIFGKKFSENFIGGFWLSFWSWWQQVHNAGKSDRLVHAICSRSFFKFQWPNHQRVTQ